MRTREAAVTGQAARKGRTDGRSGESVARTARALLLAGLGAWLAFAVLADGLGARLLHLLR